MVKINELNQKINIQEETKTNDGVGGFVSEWKTKKSIWCKIELNNIQLEEKYKTLIKDSNYIITIRKLNCIKEEGIRLVLGNKIFLIRYIDESDKKFTKIFCFN